MLICKTHSRAVLQVQIKLCLAGGDVEQPTAVQLALEGSKKQPGNNTDKKDKTRQPRDQITVHRNRNDNRLRIDVTERKGYKEQHDLVVVDRSDESDDGDEQQEDAHCDDPPDDVDAGHQAEALPPCRHSY
ncbi:hypothetical protein EYF80_016517 [Liparis tanakae]|uniref:Uncharacterized protein n=1 Tax=Liparis tanakae TaxID=230148 RepID=A0A4Z2I7Q8_9TELE|nr:hypothetical protein EYF80_016517 [Liparis tanakae]